MLWERHCETLPQKWDQMQEKSEQNGKIYWRPLKRRQHPQSNESITMEYNQHIPEPAAGKQRHRPIKKGVSRAHPRVSTYTASAASHARNKRQSTGYGGFGFAEDVSKEDLEDVFSKAKEEETLEQREENKKIKEEALRRKRERGAKLRAKKRSRQTWSALRWWSSERRGR